MSKIISIEPAIDPNARPTFLLDWELTLKCNLDCSYCPTPEQTDLSKAYHDNSAQHPSLSECLETIDFMYQYVDLYMSHKPRWNRGVVLNVYGGESLFHPDIVEILENVKSRHQPYKDSWPLTITCTTNGVVGPTRFQEVINLVDEFTVSYHVESLPKQKQQVRDNLLSLRKKNKRVKCVILMHGDQQHWPELMDIIEFCQQNDIKYLPRHLDGNINANYGPEQIVWFKNLWSERSPVKSQDKQKEIMSHHTELEQADSVTLSKVGRACCGGRLMCANSDLKHPTFYVPDNNFQGWDCSVNWFFLYIKQYTKEIFVNKDCRMNFQGQVGPIGTLDRHQELITSTKEYLEKDQMPIINCAKNRCTCGLCAPKAKTQEEFITIMKKHIKNTNVFLTKI